VGDVVGIAALGQQHKYFSKEEDFPVLPGVLGGGQAPNNFLMTGGAGAPGTPICISIERVFQREKGRERCAQLAWATPAECVYVHSWMYIYIYICIWIRACVCACVRVCVCACGRVWACVGMCGHVWCVFVCV